MPETKISLMDMAEEVGDAACAARGHVQRWDRDHPDDPLAPDNQWVLQARRFETAHLTLSLMALDEAASRKFVSSIIAAKPAEAGQLTAMIRPFTSRTNTIEAVVA